MVLYEVVMYPLLPQKLSFLFIRISTSYNGFMSMIMFVSTVRTIRLLDCKVLSRHAAAYFH